MFPDSASRLLRRPAQLKEATPIKLEPGALVTSDHEAFEKQNKEGKLQEHSARQVTALDAVQKSDTKSE